MINHDKLISYLKKWLEKQEQVSKTREEMDRYKIEANPSFIIGFSFVLMHLFAFFGILLGIKICTQTRYYSYILLSIVSLIVVVWYDREFIKYRKSPRNKIDKLSMSRLLFVPIILIAYLMLSTYNGVLIITLLFVAIIGLGILLFIARVYSPYFRNVNLVDIFILISFIGSLILTFCLAQQGNDTLAVISLSMFGVSLCLFFIVEIITTCLYRKNRDELYGIEKPKDLFNS